VSLSVSIRGHAVLVRLNKQRYHAPACVSRVDLLVDRKVIVECKTASTLHAQHEAQMLHYLEATNTELGLLMYFGSKPLFRRFVHTSDVAGP
jgi:GxxExxY protein